jgi:hypothetical protein
MFSGRVVLARMDLSTGAVTEEEVSTEDLWEIRLYRDESTKNYTTLIASDGGFITAKAYQPSRRVPRVACFRSTEERVMEYAIFAAHVVILILIAAVYGHMHRVSELLEEIAAQGRPAFRRRRSPGEDTGPMPGVRQVPYDQERGP